MIPTTSSRVNVDDLDPVLAYRVELMLNDPRMKGYRVVSAVRTYASQKRLYSGWRSRLPGYNLAANPDRLIGTDPAGVKFRGSFHMQQADGYGHAVDLRAPIHHSTKKRWQLIGEVGQAFGLQQVVPSEYWHVQARTIRGYFDGPHPPGPDNEGDDMEILNDTEASRMWATWTKDGTTHVREYGTYRGLKVGKTVPGMGYVIDEQVQAGNIVKV